MAGVDPAPPAHPPIHDWCDANNVLRPPVRQAINYSSRLEDFAVQHWSSERKKTVREEDVEAAAEEPLLGTLSPGHKRSVFGLPMLQPNHPAVEALSFLTLLTDMSYTAFAVPISIAFGTHLGRWSWMSAWDLVAGTIFALSILQNLQTGMVVKYNLQRQIVMDGLIVAKYYLLEGNMIVDVLSTFPSILQALSLVGMFGRSHMQLVRALLALRWLRMLRLVIFLRAQFVASLLGRLGRRLLAWRMPLINLYLLDILYTAMLLTNLLGCIWLFTARCEGLENSWLADVGGDDLTVSKPLEQYFAAVLFAMATMSTVGYGDIRAKTTPERGVTLVIMLVGVLFFGYIVNSIGRLLEMSSTEARRAILFRDKINKVDAWMSFRNLPGKVRSDITGYYANSWVNQCEIHETSLFEELPAFLKGQVASHLLRNLLEASGLWQAVPESEQWRLAALLHPKTLLPGHDLCQEGEPADCLWLLQEGEMLAIKHAVQWEPLQAPAIVGEEALLQKENTEFAIRPCTYRATGGCTLWTLVLAELEPLMRVFPDLRTCLTSILHQRAGSSLVRRSMDLSGWERSNSMAAHAKGGGPLNAGQQTSTDGSTTDNRDTRWRASFAEEGPSESGGSQQAAREAVAADEQSRRGGGESRYGGNQNAGEETWDSKE